MTVIYAHYSTGRGMRRLLGYELRCVLCGERWQAEPGRGGHNANSLMTQAKQHRCRRSETPDEQAQEGSTAP